WPEGLLDRALAWLTTEPAPAVKVIATGTRDPAFDGQGGALAAALAYRRLGWAVVPQRPGSKQPCVRWREYQDRLPAEQELEGWFRRWPEAGMAVVLGPVSGLFVIDVDGPEAHAALLSRLGQEPVAPRSSRAAARPAATMCSLAARRCPHGPRPPPGTPS